MTRTLPPLWLPCWEPSAMKPPESSPPWAPYPGFENPAYAAVIKPSSALHQSFALGPILENSYTLWAVNGCVMTSMQEGDALWRAFWWPSLMGFSLPTLTHSRRQRPPNRAAKVHASLLVAPRLGGVGINREQGHFATANLSQSLTSCGLLCKYQVQKKHFYTPIIKALC